MQGTLFWVGLLIYPLMSRAMAHIFEALLLETLLMMQMCSVMHNDTSVSMSLHAHIAMYKVCILLFGCAKDAILAAIDVAIDDGVNVISISLGVLSQKIMMILSLLVLLLQRERVLL